MIYLEEDASEFLGEETKLLQRYAMQKMRAIQKRGRKLTIRRVEGDIEPTTILNGQATLLCTFGAVDPHDDLGFPRHTLLYILREAKCRVRARGAKMERHKVGTLVAFNCHQIHRLERTGRRKKDPKVWIGLAMDSDRKWTPERARTKIKKIIEQVDIHSI